MASRIILKNPLSSVFVATDCPTFGKSPYVFLYMASLLFGDIRLFAGRLMTSSAPFAVLT